MHLQESQCVSADYLEKTVKPSMDDPRGFDENGGSSYDPVLVLHEVSEEGDTQVSPDLHYKPVYDYAGEAAVGSTTLELEQSAPSVASEAVADSTPRTEGAIQRNF